MSNYFAFLKVSATFGLNRGKDETVLILLVHSFGFLPASFFFFKFLQSFDFVLCWKPNGKPTARNLSLTLLFNFRVDLRAKSQAKVSFSHT